MNDLNSILIEGYLTNDAVLEKNSNGISVCTFPIASTKYYEPESGMEKEVSYFEIQAYGKLAEASHNQAHHGRRVRVVGRIKQNRWNNVDGKPHSKMVIVAEHIEYRPEDKADKANRRKHEEE